MLNVGKKRLLMVTVLLGLCVFAAGWAVLREFGEENVDLKLDLALPRRSIDENIGRREGLADFSSQVGGQSHAALHEELERTPGQQLVNRAVMVQCAFDDPLVDQSAGPEDPFQKRLARIAAM